MEILEEKRTEQLKAAKQQLVIDTSTNGEFGVDEQKYNGDDSTFWESTLSTGTAGKLGNSLVDGGLNEFSINEKDFFATLDF